MRRLLVTGASGFTGVHLSKLAALSGYEVCALRADLTNFQNMVEEVAAIGPTHVCHLAAISSLAYSDEEAFYKVNLFGTINLLKALVALPNKLHKILLVSSANVYGNVDSNLITEATCPKPISHYAMSKLAMEHLALSFAERLPIVLARPFNYTGVGQDNRFVIPKIAEHFARGVSEIELGHLDVEREYNDVRMICDAYLKLIDVGKVGEVYNICSGRSHSLRYVLSLMNEISGFELSVKVNPALIRPNEVQRLSGSPAKLESVIGSLKHRDLKETLLWIMADMSPTISQ